jgi:hypothetical protein
MHHIFEVNGSSVILSSTEDAMRIIKSNPDRVISSNQTERWETWSRNVLAELGLEELSIVEGRFDPDAARVLLASKLLERPRLVKE